MRESVRQSSRRLRCRRTDARKREFRRAPSVHDNELAIAYIGRLAVQTVEVGPWDRTNGGPPLCRGASLGLTTAMGGILAPKVANRRDRERRTKPLRGGEDRDLVPKRSASPALPTDSDFAPHLYRCAVRATLRMATLGSGLGLLLHFSAGTLPSLRPLPICSIYIKAKAVPVAASSSAVVSARPMRPGGMPRSATALRIQDSAKDAAGAPSGRG
jgi:hypothetical protein